MGLYVPGVGAAQWVKLTGRGAAQVGDVSFPDRTLPGAYGTFMPNSPLYSGLRPGWTPEMLTPVYGNGTSLSVTAGEVYENKIFWCEVRPQSAVLPKFINCAFAGKNPTLYTTLGGLVKCYGSGYYQWHAQDCLFDGGLWLEPTLNASRNAPPTDLATWRKKMGYSTAVHGGRGTMKDCEVRRVADGWNFVQKYDATLPNSFVLIEGGWFHENAYYWGPDWTATTDGSHSDGFQFNIGPNMTMRGTYMGGVRDEVGYNTYDPAEPSGPTSYNSGDDAWNAEFMIKQEVSTADENLLKNILIEDVFIEGGTYGINHVYSTTRPWDFPTTTIRNTKHVFRADGRYAIVDDQVLHCYSNNRVIFKDAGAPGGFTTGGLINFTRG